jgi:hypothetical protein
MSATINVKVNLDLPTTVPEKMVRLLGIDKKAELQRYCDSISVTTEDLASLIMNCGQLGYVHDMRTYEKRYIDPPDLTKLWPMGKYKPGDTLDKTDQKLSRKMGSVFSQRRLMTVHVFVAAPDRWHVVFFTQNDMQGEHWEHGPHVHFANYLWPEYLLDSVLKIFSDPTGWLGGSIHLRYLDQKRDKQ